MTEFLIGIGAGAVVGVVGGFFGAIWLLDQLTRDVDDDKAEWRRKCEKAERKAAKEERK